MATIFKLQSRDNETRRISFNHTPSWNVLAQKIHVLYDIPFDKLAVVYIDADGDKVTLSTEEELQDFYRTSYKQDSVAKFTVQDLRQSRAESLRSVPETPTETLNGSSRRNTFGGRDPVLQFSIDEDWTSIPAFTSMFQKPPPPSEHGFLESVTSTTDDESFPKLDKGKGRAFTPSFQSTASSVIGDPDMMTSTPRPAVSDFAPFSVQDKELPQLYSVASSTPRMESHPLKRNQNSVIPFVGKESAKGSVKGTSSNAPTPANRPSSPMSESSAEDESDAAPDPPLPPLHYGDAPPSLAKDIATLIDAFGAVFHSHPEISESFKNVIRNASSGAYDAIAKAASEYSQSAAQESSRSDADAGQRVSEALVSLARTVAEAAGGAAFNVGRPTASGPEDDGPWWRRGPPGLPPFMHTPTGHPHHMHGPGPWGSREPPPPGGDPFSPPHFSGGRGGRGGGHRGGRGHFGPHGPPRGPPPRPPPAGEMNNFPPGPPPDDMFSMQYPELFPGPPPSHHYPHHNHGQDHHKQVEVPGHLDPGRTRELRAEVEAAKLLYKKQKERYRQDRAERQRLRVHVKPEVTQDTEIASPAPPSPPAPPAMVPPFSTPRPASITQLVSQGRGGFPPVEMVGVAPKRSHTHSGHVNPKERAIARITRKLADMGFTESGHPNMTSTIRAHVPEHGDVSKEVEDNIVTTFIEELEEEPREEQPRASGSSSKW